MAKRGNPNLDQVRVKFAASDDWGEALADKPTQVKLPQSMKDYVDAQPDRGAWLRRAVAAAIEAEQSGTSPVPVPVPRSPAKYSKEELQGLSVQDLRKLVSAEGGATKRDGKALTKTQAMDFLLKIAGQ